MDTIKQMVQHSGKLSKLDIEKDFRKECSLDLFDENNYNEVLCTILSRECQTKFTMTFEGLYEEHNKSFP